MIVYHYCSLAVFEKIITRKAIRLSDISKSNDSMEISWIARYIVDIFDKEFQKEAEKTKYFRMWCEKEDFFDLLKRYTNEFFAEDHGWYSFFVSCFSKDGDLLSQWRGYADDAKGVSIGFDSEILKKIGEPMPNDPISSPSLFFQEVIYSQNQQKEYIKKKAKQLINDLKHIAKNCDDLSESNIKGSILRSYNLCFLSLFQLSIFMKNPFFREEKEFRLCRCAMLDYKSKQSDIYIRDGLRLSDFGFAYRKDDIVPYIDLLFGNCSYSLVKEVILGPRCNIRENDIKTFLMQNGISCDVKKSVGTYR